MKKVVKLICCITALVALIATLCACGFIPTASDTIDVKVTEEKSAVSSDKFDLLGQVIDFVEQRGINGVDYDVADVYAANALVSSLGNFNYFYSEQALNASSVATGGFGLIVKFNYCNDIMVDCILPGSPMLETVNGYKMQRGDMIYAVNGVRVEGAGSDYFKALTATIQLGETAKFTMKRDGKILEVEPEYTKVDFTFPQTVYINDLNGVPADFGYILLRSFSDYGATAKQEFLSAITSFNADGNKALILDLRGNGGGSSFMLEYVASFLLGQPTGGMVNIIEVQVKNSAPLIVSTSLSDNYVKTPIYVLTDGNTASASEALIGAMKAHGTLTAQIGSATVGKGVAQNSIPSAFGTAEQGCFTDYVTNDDGNKVRGERYYAQVVVGEYYIYDSSAEGGKYCMNGIPFEPEGEFKITEQNVISPDYSKDLCIAAAIKDYNK